MKKLLCFLLVSIFALSVFPSCNTPANASEPWPEANPAQEFAYELMSGDAAVRIRGYIGTEAKVVIPSEIEGKPVVSIDPGTDFSDPWSAVEELYIPSSVQNIGNRAFDGAHGLLRVNFEKREQPIRIGYRAFAGCTGLEKLAVPQYAILGNRVFENCSGLREIFIPKTTIFRGYTVFSGCSSAEKMIFEDGLSKLDIRGFFYGMTALKSITLPASVSEISDDVFCFFDGLETVTFLGDAPKLLSDDPNAELITNTSTSPQEGERVTIYYDPATKGWDTFAYATWAYELVPLPSAKP